MIKKIVSLTFFIVLISACSQVEAQDDITDEYFSQGEEYLEVSRGNTIGLRYDDYGLYYFSEWGGSSNHLHLNIEEVESNNFGRLIELIYEQDVDRENWERLSFYNGNGNPESFSSVVLNDELFYLTSVDDSAVIFFRDNEIGRSLISDFEGITVNQITGYGRTDESSQYAEAFETFWNNEAGFIFLLED